MSSFFDLRPSVARPPSITMDRLADSGTYILPVRNGDFVVVFFANAALWLARSRSQNHGLSSQIGQFTFGFVFFDDISGGAVLGRDGIVYGSHLLAELLSFPAWKDKEIDTSPQFDLSIYDQYVNVLAIK